MTNLIYVLLFVLFPPADVLSAQPDAKPIVQAAQAASLDDCKAKATAALKNAAADFPGAAAFSACAAIPAPDTAAAPKTDDAPPSAEEPDAAPAEPADPMAPMQHDI